MGFKKHEIQASNMKPSPVACTARRSTYLMSKAMINNKKQLNFNIAPHASKEQ
jgi:hypothetical protein